MTSTEKVKKVVALSRERERLKRLAKGQSRFVKKYGNLPADETQKQIRHMERRIAHITGELLTLLPND